MASLQLRERLAVVRSYVVNIFQARSTVSSAALETGFDSFERELAFTFAICYHPSVCRLSSVTFVRPTQAVQIFGNISTALGTLAIENFMDIVPGEPLRRGS